MFSPEDLERIAGEAAAEVRSLRAAKDEMATMIGSLQREISDAIVDEERLTADLKLANETVRSLEAEVGRLKAELEKRPHVPDPPPPPPPPPPPIRVAPDMSVDLPGFGTFRPGLEGEAQRGEVRYSGEVGPLRVLIDVNKDEQKRIIIERCKADLPSNAPVLNTRMTIKVGSAVRHDAPLRLHHHQRPTKVLDPSPPPTFDLAALIKARLVPNYDMSARPSEDTLARIATGRNPWQRWDTLNSGFDQISENFGLFHISWQAGPEASPLNPAEVAFLLSGDPRAWEAVRQLADSSGCYPIHYKVPDSKGGHFPWAEEMTGLPFLQGPDPVTIRTASGAICPIPDTAHQHSLCYLAALLTGSRYWREEADALRSYNLLARPPQEERLKGIIHSGQERATAWGLRTLLLAAMVDGEGDLSESAAHAEAELRANLKYLNDTFVNPASKLHRPTGVTSTPAFRKADLLSYVKPTTPMPPYIATWHYPVMAMVLDWCFLAGFHEAAPIRDHVLKVSEGVWKHSPTFWDFPHGNHAYPADDWARVMASTFEMRTSLPTFFTPHVTPDYLGWARFGPVVGARLGQPWAVEALKKIDSEAPRYKGGIPAVLKINP